MIKNDYSINNSGLIGMGFGIDSNKDIKIKYKID